MFDEGYIKFKSNWIRSNLNEFEQINELNRWREKLYAKELIGAYDNGVGFGNLSSRIGRSSEFIISGSATGNNSLMISSHYTKVINFNLQENSLTCHGPIVASSESLTHAVLYTLDPDIKAVIHAHDLALWENFKGKVPTTSASVAYGTPQMAEETIRLYEQTDLPETKFYVMGGHHEGVVSFGETLEEAFNIILQKLCDISNS